MKMSYEFVNENNLIYQFDEIDFENSSDENKKKILDIWKDYYNYYYYYYYYNYYNYNYYYNYYYYYYYYNYNYNYYSVKEIQFFILSVAYHQDQMDKMISNKEKGTPYEID